VAGEPGGRQWAYIPSMANVIDYVELAVDDLEQAKAFYAKALGWAFNDYGGEYAGIKDRGNPSHEFGGLNPVAASSRGDGVLALVHSDDVEAALASVQAAGGRVVVELHEYPGGRRFTFADPSGNILGVYQPGE
jgi:predicted enzyme related to lactoylglutathione lyase